MNSLVRRLEGMKDPRPSLALTSAMSLQGELRLYINSILSPGGSVWTLSQPRWLQNRFRRKQ